MCCVACVCVCVCGMCAVCVCGVLYVCVCVCFVRGVCACASGHKNKRLTAFHNSVFCLCFV
jgi:hypothetical protein